MQAAELQPDLEDAGTQPPAIEQCVYLALPRRPGYQAPGQDGLKDEAPGKVKVIRPVGRGRLQIGRSKISILCRAFNTLWACALNLREKNGITHFAMQHDDIVPEVAWCDEQIDRMRAVGADVISAVVPIKDTRYLTTTGIRNVNDGSMRRITLKELKQLPDVFNLQDVQELFGVARAGDILAINTGLWTCRFTEPWVEAPFFPGFQSFDNVGKLENGKFLACGLSEDWAWSEWLQLAAGLKVWATKQPLGHWDDEGTEYRTDEDYPEGAEHDPGDRPLD
ncbi:MAG TPA: hypothetical protein VKS79_21235 [Gemmataceae bacterium]|nr:hypothetical protein [Gemmataceae bacterium]